MAAFDLLNSWPVPHRAAAVISADGIDLHGEVDRSFRLASVSKLITAWAALVAIEEGSIALDDAAGPEGSTVRHLLCHASGLPFDGAVPVTRPGRTRVYSNTGVEVLAAFIAERTGIGFDRYVVEAVTGPLGMASFEPVGSPAKGFRCTARDLARFGAELLAPTLLAPGTVAEATSPVFPELSGVIPGLGRYSPNPWGLGPEIKGAKAPHWTAPANSPTTFGHFGGSGTFLWVDPAVGLSCLALANREFVEWAMDYWPAFSQAVLAEYTAAGGPSPTPA